MTASIVRFGFVLVVGSSPWLVACGAEDAVRPDAPTAGEAMGTKCDPTADSTNVFVVDLPPETRSDLELAVSSGSLAVAKFDCKEIKILKTCKAAGEYQFRGTSAKERVLSLESADEIRAALPLGGAGIAATFEAEASAGTKFDLGMVLAGQMVGSSSSFMSAELTGNCAGATHVISTAKMGAFAMGTSAKAEMRTAAEVFGAGASAGSASSKLTKARDGSIKACEAAEAGGEKPPKGCDALIALEVTRLTADLADTDADGLGLGDLLATLNDLKCDDAAACEAGCNAGKGRSCAELGVSLISGLGMEKNVPRGRALLKKSCELSDVKGCSAFAEILASAGDKFTDEAIAAAEKACNVGNDGYACNTLGNLWERKGDAAKAEKYKSKACVNGVEFACKKPE